MSTLVAYFSATGTTARAARRLAEAIGADLFEIAPEQPYTSADLNWNDKNSRSSREMADEKCRPAVAGNAPGMSAYDTVFVGFPIWWYVEPRIIDTFLEAHDLSGKTIVPFATSGGSGLGGDPNEAPVWPDHYRMVLSYVDGREEQTVELWPVEGGDGP